MLDKTNFLLRLTQEIEKINKYLRVNLETYFNEQNKLTHKVNILEYSVPGFSLSFDSIKPNETENEQKERYEKIITYIIECINKRDIKDREKIYNEFNKLNIKPQVTLSFENRSSYGDCNYDAYNMTVIIKNKIYKASGLFPYITNDYVYILNDYLNKDKIEEFEYKIKQLGFEFDLIVPNSIRYKLNKFTVMFYTNGKIIFEDRRQKECKDWAYEEFQTFEELKEYLDSINL